MQICLGWLEYREHERCSKTSLNRFANQHVFKCGVKTVCALHPATETVQLYQDSCWGTAASKHKNISIIDLRWFTGSNERQHIWDRAGEWCMWFQNWFQFIPRCLVVHFLLLNMMYMWLFLCTWKFIKKSPHLLYSGVHVEILGIPICLKPNRTFHKFWNL